jgi:hypothetical protein
MTLIPIDEYVRRDARPTEAIPFPRRVTPVITQCVGDEWYVRVHRRVGEDRLLTDRELADWANRIQSMDVKPKRVWMMWNTNWETQAIDNARRLEEMLPANLVMNWKQHYLEVQKNNPSSIFSFFKAGGKPAAGAAAKVDNEEDEDEEIGEPKSSVDSPNKRPDPPVAAASVAAPSPQKKARVAPEGNTKINSFFKKQ